MGTLAATGVRAALVFGKRAGLSWPWRCLGFVPMFRVYYSATVILKRSVSGLRTALLFLRWLRTATRRQMRCFSV